MKVVLYMAITVNGYIAKEDDDTGFTSDIEWESYRNMARKVGNMIIGQRTYKISLENNSFEDLEKVKVVVVTTKESMKTNNSNHFLVKSPQEALAQLHDLGFETMLVAGGGKLNASFLAENLIDEIYLDIEPTVFGQGIKLFVGKDFTAKLKLLGTKKLSPNELQLHYKVLKS
ncbi:dihydrofolate reductase family protein [Candidatus Gottesmanbacteria bacterium]|nr:dihydrofolate reductase family protein [Candidatus Gottesmanbacteria bacterium]